MGSSGGAGVGSSPAGACLGASVAIESSGFRSLLRTRGKVGEELRETLDNDRYPAIRWTTVRDVLSGEFGVPAAGPLTPSVFSRDHPSN